MLATGVIRSWRSTLLDKGRSEDRTAKACRLARAILNTALDDGRIKRNPCRIKGAGEHRTAERPTATVRQVYALAERSGCPTGSARSFWPPPSPKASLPIGFHFHDLRHTGNQFAANSGATTRELMHRMGHGSMRVALIYQHASNERDPRIAQEMAALVERERRPGVDYPDGSEDVAETS